MNIHPYTFAGLPQSIIKEMKYPSPRMLQQREILKLIEVEFNIDEVDLITNSKGGREREVKLIPRQVYQYLLRKHTDLSLPKIGKLTNRNHASVIHSINKIEQVLNWEKDMFHNIVKKVVEKANKI